MQITLQPGNVWCPHCKGTTKCDCGSCGVIRTFPMDSKEKMFIAGICQVCKGKGQIPEK